MKNLNILLNFMAALVIFVAVIGVLYLGFEHLRKNDSPRKIIIEYQTLQDSLKTNSVVELSNIDSLLQEIKQLTNEIQLKQIETISSVEEKNVFDKFYSIIVAIILVFAGFFGFKNITEIKQRALEDAQESAKKIAEETAIDSSRTQFEKIFTKEYKGQIMMLSTESFARLFDQESTRINEQITGLENRIEILEGHKDNNNVDFDEEQEDDNGKINTEPLNPFDNE